MSWKEKTETHIAISTTPVTPIISHQSDVFKVPTDKTLSDFLLIMAAADQADPELLEIFYQLASDIDCPTQSFEI
jgi:hypothetical protein